MSSKIMYTIAKCSTEKPCKKCNTIADNIVVNRGTHYCLYCSKCGAYIKQANNADKRYFYLNKVRVENLTPVKVCSLYADSEKTMLNR